MVVRVGEGDKDTRVVGWTIGLKIGRRGCGAKALEEEGCKTETGKNFRYGKRKELPNSSHSTGRKYERAVVRTGECFSIRAHMGVVLQTKSGGGGGRGVWKNK